MTTENEETQEELDAQQEEAEFEAAFKGEEAPERPRDEKGRFVPQQRASEQSDEYDGTFASPEKEEEEQEVEAKGEQDEEKSQEDDPREEEPTEDDKLAQRLRRVEGRLGSLNSDLQRVLSTQDELKSAFSASRQTEAAGGDAPTKAQVKEALESGEKMSALKDEFPEWAEAMEEERNRTIEHLRGEMGGMLTREEAEQLAQRAREEARDEARALARLDARHEGWEDEVKTPEFVAWVRQDEELVNLANSDVVSDSIELLDRWKNFRETRLEGKNREADREAERERTESRLRRSIPATQSRGASQERVPSEEEDFVAGFEGR